MLKVHNGMTNIIMAVILNALPMLNLTLCSLLLEKVTLFLYTSQFFCRSITFATGGFRTWQ